MACVVYQLLFSNGKSYIGLTLDIVRRLRQHAVNNSKSVIGYAWQKYGVPVVRILFEGTVEQCQQKEMHHIKECSTRSPLGYNLTDGGDGVRNLDAAVRKILSNKAKKQDLTAFQKAGVEARRGKPSHNRGKKASLETRKKMSEARMGATPWNKGRAWTEEEREMLSKAHLGHRPSEETKEKMRGPRGPYGPRTKGLEL